MRKTGAIETCRLRTMMRLFSRNIQKISMIASMTSTIGMGVMITETEDTIEVIDTRIVIEVATTDMENTIGMVNTTTATTMIVIEVIAAATDEDHTTTMTTVTAIEVARTIFQHMIVGLGMHIMIGQPLMVRITKLANQKGEMTIPMDMIAGLVITMSLRIHEEVIEVVIIHESSNKQAGLSCDERISQYQFLLCQMLLPLSCIKPDAPIVVKASSRGKLVNRTSAVSELLADL